MAIVAVLPGCSAPARNAGNLPPGPQEIAVGMSEYRFEHPSQALPGRAVIRVRNLGASPHELTMVRLEPGQSVTAPDRVRGQPLATVVVLPTLGPGSEEVFAVDLASGRYGFVCFLKDPDGVQHVDKGMASELSVG